MKGETLRENGCYDCAICTGRMELDLGGGSNPQEIELLAQRCPDCSHVYRRHMLASVRRSGLMKSPALRFHVDPPPRDSPLGQLLIARGE